MHTRDYTDLVASQRNPPRKIMDASALRELEEAFPRIIGERRREDLERGLVGACK